MSESLDDLLNDEVQEAPEEEVTEVETEDSAEEDQATGENESESPSPEDTKEELTEEETADQGHYQAMKAERAKRQDLEREAEELRQKLAEKDQPEPELPDPVEDPQGYAKALEDQNAKSQFAMRTALSQELMREKHADYDEKEAAFVELTKSDPTLVTQLHQSSNPAKFAYDMAVKYERMAQFDNFDTAVTTEVEKQVSVAREKIEADLRKEYEAKLKTATSLPPSGAKGSLGSDNTSPGDESLSDILGE